MTKPLAGEEPIGVINVAEGPVQLANATDLEKGPIADAAAMSSVEATSAGTTAVAGGKADRADQIHVLPDNNIPLVMCGLVSCVMLAALDLTIAAIALPTIARELNASAADYSWIGSSYLLTSAALVPLWGRLSDLTGRKVILLTSIVIFLIGSALCGASQTASMLIVMRALQGLGGGGLTAMVQITISDIIPLKDRGKWGGLIGMTFGVASILGPIVGGALTQHVSWRWCFFINLPVCAPALGIVFFFLKLNPVERKPVRTLAREFDWIGLVTLVAAVTLFLAGLNNATTSYGWISGASLGLLVISGALLAVCIVNEFYTQRQPILPPKLFYNRTTGITLVCVLLHALCYFSGAYYLPIYFEVINGSSATRAGIYLLPYSLVGALMAIVAGIVISKSGRYKPIASAGYVVMALGFALMASLTSTSNTAMQICYTLVAALGVGFNFPAPLITLQAAMPMHEMAVTTSAMVLLRTLGGSLGITIGGAIFASQLKQRLPTGFVPPAELATIKHMTLAQQPLRDQALAAYGRSISTIWIVMAPLAFLCFLMSLLLKEYTLTRKVVKSAPSTAPGAAGGGKASAAAATSPADGKSLEEGRSADEERSIELEEPKLVS